MDDETQVLDRMTYTTTEGTGDAIPDDNPCSTDLADLVDLDSTTMSTPADTDVLEPVVDEEDALPADATATADTPEDVQARQVLEALLFAADVPLPAARLADLIDGCTPLKIRLHIAALNDKYAAAGLTFRIEAIARGYRMMTLSEFEPWLSRLNQQRRRTRLTGAALETVSIIAYKQPIIRADVEAIRGVACGDVLNRLREMGLVKIVGRAEVVGRPLLYGTTKKFLDVFGLEDVEDLPPLEALAIRRQNQAEPDAEAEPAEPPVLAASA
ncbi:MAG: SMC-Scp complex subunit ScpB [Phycisphaerae bacterium]|jgi:segregation and condensation protein B